MTMTGTTEPSFFNKQPAEKITLTIDYAGRLPDSVTVSSATVGAVNRAGANSTSTVITSATATIAGDGLSATFQVKAGTEAEKYKITITATLSNGDVFEDDLIMEVLER